MASVRMSNQLRANITQQGEGIFLTSIQRLQNNLADDIHDRAAAEYIAKEITPHILNMRPEWMGNVAEITYSIRYQLTSSNNPKETFKFDTEALLKKVRIPKILGLYVVGYGQIKSLYVPDKFEFSYGLVQEVTKWQTAIADTEAERRKFMNELKKILKRCNTLKQFLDVWPQGENLISPTVLAKLHARPVREKKEPMLSEEASVELSVTLLKRKLMS